MDNDDSIKTQSLPKPPPNSELSELLTQVRGALAMVQTIANEHEKLWTRVTWLTKLESSKADHVLRLATVVERDATARDRQSEAVLLATQRLTEIYDQREYLRGGIDTLRASLDALHNAIKLERSVEKKVKKAIQQGVREATGSIKTQDADAGAGDLQPTKRVALGFFRLGHAFLRAPIHAQLLAVFLVALLVAAFGGWVTLKVHQSAPRPAADQIEHPETPKSLE